MSTEEYREALRMGQKAYREAVNNGRYPYLPVLDDITANTTISTEMSLGIVEVPMSLIVGTKTASRTNSFAHNFMPLLGSSSEFAMKWTTLSTQLQEEGQRDPIKVYEYLNHFYVMEGNKRVSVMKYLGAAAITGNVIRVIPKPTDTHENKLYYEFMAFYDLAQINYICFSKLGSYNKLQMLVGKEKNEVWSDDDKLTFHSFFIRFEKSYTAKAGSKPPISASDALLLYLNVYPYEKVKGDMQPQFKVNLDKIWEEFVVHEDNQAIELMMNPNTDSKTTVLTKLFTAESRKTLNIAFIHDKNGENSGWTYGHELGRLHLEQKYPERISTTVYENVNSDDIDAATNVIEEAIRDGNKIIFTTTPKLLNASLKAAVAHPEVKILNCSINATHPYIRTYYGRMYEAKFLIGAIAGALADNDRIGYIADYPIYGTIANINAFALGAQMVNPRARIILEWSTVKDRDIHENLKKNGACFISDRDMITPQYASREFGLYYEDASVKKGETVPENMATPIWHWGRFYELIIKSIMTGSWKSDAASGPVKAINYWWGMSAGVIDMILSQNMPAGTRKLIEMIRQNICNGSFHPFSGILKDQEGNIRHKDDEPMSSEEIIKMDWLVEGIEGTIPTMSELKDDARKIVMLQGVKKEDEDETGTETV